MFILYMSIVETVKCRARILDMAYNIQVWYAYPRAAPHILRVVNPEIREHSVPQSLLPIAAGSSEISPTFDRRLNFGDPRPRLGLPNRAQHVLNMVCNSYPRGRKQVSPGFSHWKSRRSPTKHIDAPSLRHPRQ